MKTYRQYWTFTAIVLTVVIFALSQGVLVWALQKFPEWPIEVAVGFILVTFAWTYGRHGHASAKLLARSEHALLVLNKGVPSINDRSEVRAMITRTQSLRARGLEVGQTDFSILYERMNEKLHDVLMDSIGRIDTVRVFLFFLSLFFTLVGIVQGLGVQLFPTNSEEAKVFGFNIIKALGLAYLPATACIGSTVVLFALSSMLQSRAYAVLSRFSDILYDVAILDVKIVASRTDYGETQTRRISHAQTS